jgi:hypothetical protein
MHHCQARKTVIVNRSSDDSCFQSLHFFDDVEDLGLCRLRNKSNPGKPRKLTIIIYHDLLRASIFTWKWKGHLLSRKWGNVLLFLHHRHSS